MTGTERKRAWRLRNPEHRREAERERAKARRNGYWGDMALGQAPRLCQSSESYERYESSHARWNQRLWYPKLGAGAHRMSKAERAEAIRAYGQRRRDELAAMLGMNVNKPPTFEELITYAITARVIDVAEVQP
jgi:hypothetical protein